MKTKKTWEVLTTSECLSRFEGYTIEILDSKWREM